MTKETADRLPNDSPFRVQRTHQISIDARGVSPDTLISRIKACVTKNDIADPKVSVYSGYSYGSGWIQISGKCPMTKAEMARKAKALKSKETKLREELARLNETIQSSPSFDNQ